LDRVVQGSEATEGRLDLGTSAMSRGSEDPRSPAQIRALVAERLQARRAEIEAAIFARVRAVPDSVGDGDAEYAVGLRAAVAAAVEYALTGIERGEDAPLPTPQAAAEQARRAVRSGVTLETVLRRYAAGDRVLGEFVVEEADRFPRHVLRHVVRVQAAQADRLMAAVADEYRRESELVGRSREQRLTEQVQRLLAGRSAESVELGYELDGFWHLGAIASGAGAHQAVRSLTSRVSGKLLVVPRSEATVWMWIAERRRPSAKSVERMFAVRRPEAVSLALGEPGRGLEGWRLTHCQAQAALQVALREPQTLAQYADTMLVAAALRDDTLGRSLREVYLSPLGENSDGTRSRETLRAYFTTGSNAATAAVKLGVDRHTVERRLGKIEQRLSRSLQTCRAELEVALRLEELGGAGGAGRSALSGNR
jgi:hypothetical protein